ncbi:hypothetical protein Mcup_0697 [Metallosphaera cuprina Ar-4]|uniref:Uncharacterized protein n=2 Tax=Metallosphaera TaxID=41980 RepID=F4G1I9_METCR|nr:hypothetical protein Mcup_0697 [Metallosphaera cuprina Ar-4]
MGFSQTEIEKDKMLDLSPEELQKRVRERMGMSLNNGHKQKVVPMKEVESMIEQGGNMSVPRYILDAVEQVEAGVP